MGYLSRLDAVNDVSGLHSDVSSEMARALVRRGWSPARAEDIVSDSFAAVLALDDARLVAIDNMRAYLHAVSRSMASKEGALLHRESSAPDEHLDRGETEGGFTEIDLAANRSLARASFATLAPDEQRILWYAVIEGRSMKEIAETLGKKVTAVTTQLSRARAALREAYIRAFLEETPPSCGYDMRKLARVISDTASTRMRRDYDAHAQECEECPALEHAARDELKWGSTLIAIVALGGSAAGFLTSSDAARAEEDHSSGTRRLLFALCGLLAGILLLTIAGFTSVQEPRSATALIEVGSSPRAGQSLQLTALPAAIARPLPAPGESAMWESEVRNTGASSAALFLSLRTNTRGSLGEGVSLELTVAQHGETVTQNVRAEVLEAGILYLGTVVSGATVPMTITAARDRSDEDQSVDLEMTTTYLGTTDVPRGLSIGDILPEATLLGDTQQNDPDRLAATGASVPMALVGAAIALLSLGFLLRGRLPGRDRRDAIHGSPN